MIEMKETPPKYSFKAHWEKDGRIGVVAAIVRSDGGVHILEDIIDMPQRTWVGLSDEDKHEIELRAGITEDDDGYIVSQVFKLIEAKLKEKNA